MRLLVAEADASLAVVIRDRFQQENFSVELVNSDAALGTLGAETQFDVLLLDGNLPEFTAIESLAILHRRWPDAPIVLLSDANAVEDRVRALNGGADDFIAKPFSLAELVARVQAMLRRCRRPVDDLYVFEDMEINRITHQVNRGGRFIPLSPKEYALLDFLLRSPGQPVSRATIIKQVWRMHSDSITNVVDVYVNYLRRKLDAGSDHPLIRTIRGVGYQIGGNHFSR
jgi:DNA-binding response OmpR family regulator